MRWAVLLSASLWACVPSSRSGETSEVRSLRQANHMPMGTVLLGAPDSRLGSTLVRCPGGGFVAGAPGTGTALHTPLGITPPAVGEELGRAIACIPGGTFSEMLAGGDGGVRKAVSGAWSPAFGAGILLSMSSSEDPQLPLLLGYDLAVAFANTSTATQVGPTLMGTNGYGRVVQWYPRQSRFAVTHALGSQVATYDYSTSSGGFVSAPTVIPGATSGFGRALAVGNVLPAPGDELIIGANGVVFVYLNDASGPVMQLAGSEASFGASLAIAPGSPALDRLLVGQPSNDTVYLFLGDAGSVYVSGPTAGEKFGASIAISQGELAIGAPEHASGSGAVYVELLPLANQMGEVQNCQVGSACMDQQCNLGECIGGVYCDTSILVPACDPAAEFCAAGECVEFDGGLASDGGSVSNDGGTGGEPDAGMVPDAGVIDSGVTDAGSVDAGSVDAGSADAGSVDAGSVDAGSSDAGSVDAGSEEPDAGVKPPKDAGVDQDGGSDAVIFTTSGCSETSVLPMLALGLTLLRRRRR